MANKLRSEYDASSEARQPSRYEKCIKLSTQLEAKLGEITVWHQTAQGLLTELGHIEAMFALITNGGLFETVLEAFNECAKRLEDVQAGVDAIIQELDKMQGSLEEMLA